MTPITHDFLRLQNVTLHIAKAGPETGPLIIFLHGFPENWYEWNKQLKFFSHHGYFSIAFDQRGYNLSSKPSNVHDYRIDMLASDVIKVANYFKRKKFILVGHDWGANVAWWTALRYSNRISKLVIINVPHPVVMKKMLFSYPKQFFNSWYIFFLQIPLLAEFFTGFNKGIVLSSMITSSAKRGVFSSKRISYYRNSWSHGNIKYMIYCRCRLYNICYSCPRNNFTT